MNQVTVRCPAKINLSFAILGKTDRLNDPHPGYHYIDSVVQTIDIYDHLTITRKDKGRIISGALVAENSLISRAVDALETAVGRELPCDVHLDKQIPIGAGMGGGSSNCAGTLAGLTELFDLDFDDDDLMDMGCHLGADVPLFFYGGCLRLTGIGIDIEQVDTWDRPPTDTIYFIFRPHKRLSTREAYEEWDRTGMSFGNQALIKARQIKDILDILPGLQISGKGPSCFIIRNEGTYQETFDLITPLIETWDGDIFVSRPCGGLEII